MTAQNPQVFEGQLDDIFSGKMSEPEVLKSVLRALYATRRRYQTGLLPVVWNSGAQRRELARPGDPPVIRSDSIAGIGFSNFWSPASQIARIEAGIAFLKPIVGAAVGDYPRAARPMGWV